MRYNFAENLVSDQNDTILFYSYLIAQTIFLKNKNKKLIEFKRNLQGKYQYIPKITQLPSK